MKSKHGLHEGVYDNRNLLFIFYFLHWRDFPFLNAAPSVLSERYARYQRDIAFMCGKVPSLSLFT